MPIFKFRDSYRWLSNFYAVPIAVDGIVYPSVEHAFQAAKTHNIDEKRQIANTANPVTARHLGRKVALRNDWDDVKVNIIRTLLEQKFTHHELASKLLDTGDEEIIEGNAWHDNFWGKCVCHRCENKDAQNMLGRIIMDIREKLKGSKSHG